MSPEFAAFTIAKRNVTAMPHLKKKQKRATMRPQMLPMR
jgi:hypothetical protein